MTDIAFRSDPTVELVDAHGDDQSIVRAARVSTGGDEEASATESHGLIRYLMSHRHGTPFEHNSMTLRVEVPLFIAREWMRHRIGWSYNETSGRYSKLEPVFHLPSPNRGLVNVGGSARPVMEAGSMEQRVTAHLGMQLSYVASWQAYERLLEAGIAKEVAREVLPVGIYTSFYATCNLRSALAFLSLRVHDEDATFVSYPQYEIEQASTEVEKIVAARFPIAYEAFVATGRVAP